MTSVFLFALVLAVVGWAARLWVLANRMEHLVVLRLDGGTFLLGRQPDGRYLVISPLGALRVLARLEAQRTADRYHAIQAALARPLRWTRAAAHLH